MNDESFERLLRAWGAAYGEAPALDRPRRSRFGSDNPIARQMEFGAKKEFGSSKPVTKATPEYMRRAGVGRRTVMGRAAGLSAPVAAYFCDPIPCRESKRHAGVPTAFPVSPELQRVEDAAKQLTAVAYLRGTCLRAKYCVQGDDELKAAWVTAQLQEVSRFAETIKVKRFRDELVQARAWMQGRLAWNLISERA